MSFRTSATDLLVIAAYLGAMAAAGIYFSRRQKSTEDYFVGARAFPGWAMGLSMLATSISSVTFLGFPAAAYALDWRLIVPNLTLPIVAVLAVVVFIPFFRRGRLTSAFEYLGERYGPAVRLYGAASFIVLQVIRLGTVLYLVSLPICLVTGADPVWATVLTGAFVAFYTVAGGIEAVVWTDVAQAIVLLGGGLVCFACMVLELPGGLPAVFELGARHGKYSLGSFEFKLGERTFWTVAFTGIVHWLTMYSSDQNMIQRYVASRSMREARKATIIYSAMAVPTWVFFFFLGTCLFVFYKLVPDPAAHALKADEVFPHFIVTRLPVGVSGLVIAGVLAAAMSSLDSNINSIATVTVVDILKPYLAPGRDERFYLRAARLASGAAAALMIGGGLVFHTLPKESMNDLVWIMGSVFGGCLMGLFMVGFFTTRVDYPAALLALCAAVALNIVLGLNSKGWLPFSLGVHDYWVAAIVNAAFVATAYVAALARGKTPGPGRLEGLTWWTTPQAPADPSAPVPPAA